METLDEEALIERVACGPRVSRASATLVSHLHLHLNRDNLLVMSGPSAGSSSSKKAEKAKRAQKGKELFDYHHGIHEEEDAKLTPEQLVKMIAEGRECVDFYTAENL